VILGGPDWAITRTLPIPPLDKRAGGGAGAKAPAPPALDGWTPTTIFRRDLGTLPACGPSPRGASFQVARSFTSVRIDGVEHGGVTSVHDVRVAGDVACLAGMSALVTLDQAQYPNQLLATGMLRRSGDLLALQGVHLDDAYLYVDGNLQVNGGLQGRGAIFVTGSLTIQGSSSFSADGMQAFLAKGDVVLAGSGKESSFFNGMIYTEGNFSANDITLVGTVVGNKPGGSTIEVQRTNILHSPASLSFHFKLPSLKPKPLNPTPVGAAGAQNFYVDVVRDPKLDFSQFYDAKTDSFSSAGLDLQKAGITFVLQRIQDGKVWKLDSAQGVGDTLQGMNVPTDQPLTQVIADLTQVGADRLEELKKQLTDLNTLYQKTRMESLKQGSFSLDPNQFLQVGEQLRKALWRHL